MPHMGTATMEAENPRARIGGNHPPADDDLLFIDARIVHKAAEYIQFQFAGLDALLTKRKDKRAMGYRKVLEYCLRGIVSNDHLSRILGINRKTIGEDQQRPERWAEIDDEFAEDIEHVRLAIIGHVSLNLERFEERLASWVEEDPELRREESKERAAALAQRRKDAANEADKERDRIKQVGQLKKTLKGVAGASAVIAEHLGPRELARRLSPEALAVIETLTKQAAKGAHPKRSTLRSGGLAECHKHGLARLAEPYLSRADDPMVGPTPLAGRVYLEAIAQGLLEKPSRRRA